MVPIPIVPIVGAVLCVIASIAIYSFNNYYLTKPTVKPTDNLSEFVNKQKTSRPADRLAFFKAVPSAEGAPTVDSNEEMQPLFSPTGA